MSRLGLQTSFELWQGFVPLDTSGGFEQAGDGGDIALKSFKVLLAWDNWTWAIVVVPGHRLQDRGATTGTEPCSRGISFRESPAVGSISRRFILPGRPWRKDCFLR